MNSISEAEQLNHGEPLILSKHVPIDLAKMNLLFIGNELTID